MEKNTSNNKVVEMESSKDFIIDNISQDKEMKDVEHANDDKGEVQITPPPPPQPTTSSNTQLDQREPSPSPLTPPITQTSNDSIQDDQVDQEVKTSKKRSRKSSSKPAVPAKRKKTSRSTGKAVGSENDVKLKKSENGVAKIKQEKSSSSLDVFNFDEDDESEDVDELMPSKSLPKKTSSANKQKSAATTTRPKRAAAEAKTTKTYKSRNTWKPDEDKILIDEILNDMPRPSWKDISQHLKDRTPNSCLNRWKTLTKRLYQNN